MKVIITFDDPGVLISSDGRAGVPHAEALSWVQQPRVRVPAWCPVLCVTAPLILSPLMLSYK